MSKLDNGLLSQCLELIWETDYRKSKAVSLVKRNRVIQCSATRFMVESKKYPNEPSKMYIIQHRSIHSKPYDLWCNCKHGGYQPDRFNVCSHVLACYLQVCLKQGSTELLTMRDVAKRKKEAQELAALEKKGNEYPDHIKQKTRVFILLKNRDWACMYEKEVLCVNPLTGLTNKYPYSLDVYSCTYINGYYHQIGVEINREKTGGGHGSKITIPKDRNRAQEIEEQHHIKVIPFNVSHMKDASDDDILQEIYQAIGVKLG